MRRWSLSPERLNIKGSVKFKPLVDKLFSICLLGSRAAECRFIYLRASSRARAAFSCMSGST